ncbi:MAG: mobilization protein [Acidobacteria bacterium]|nr:mobilization protein [Acidobacteriota bacterium]
MKNIEAANERIAKLKQRRDQLSARLQRLQQAEKARQRKLRTRRLILIGSFFEARAAEDPDLRARILQGLDGFLTKPRDRALFDLPSEAPEHEAAER